MKVISSIGEGGNAMNSLQGRWTVPNGAQEVSPAEINALRQQAQERAFQTEQRASQDALRRVEIITGLGRRTKDVSVDGTIFTLRTLKGFEQNLLAQTFEKAERHTTPNGVVLKPTSAYNVRVEALAHSIYAIDNQKIDIILGIINYDFEEQLEAKRDLIRGMDSALTEYLFIQYETLTKETYDGYMPKTSEEAKEVVETIRKSS